MTFSKTVFITLKPLLKLTLQPLRDRFTTKYNFQDYVGTNCSLNADWSAIGRRPVGDKSPIGQRSVGDKTSFRFNRRSIANQSPIIRRTVGDHLATTETLSRPKSVAALLLCMFKRNSATDLRWRYSPTGRPLLQNLFATFATYPRF